MVEITMPQLSDTMTEGTLVKWLKQEGQKVRAGEIIAEVETDKATMEMEAFEGGTIAQVTANEGDKVPVGGLLAVLATGKEDPAEIKKQYAGGKAPAKKPTEPAKQQQAEHVKTAPPASRPAPSATATIEEASNSEIRNLQDNLHGATRQQISTEPPKGNGREEGDRLRVSPLARRIAEDRGVDLTQLHGTGPGGRIVQQDVLAATQRGTAQPQPAGPTTGQKQTVPMTKMRAAIATALQRSKQLVPHFYVTIDVDMEEVIALRQRLNKQLESEKIKLSVGDFVTRAVAASLQRHPGLNAHFNGEKAEITRFGDVNLGLAVALPEGLIVPVLRGAQQMGLKEIRQRSVDLADRARQQRLKREELSGATFTVSNLGMYGVKEFSAIINPPEVGILAVSAAQKRAVVRNDQIVARSTMSLTLSADHRAVDGAAAAEFMQTLKSLLEDPAMMLV
ncbi:MAG TPA: dihydrolipoamide acetyltransferase family protein [Tepidisphaeraceae bacterium]|nr:dihydrolipoamide acetyltransferase family protein [Tepidisphaeraceae bacterium]